MARPLVNVPARARPGEIIEIKALIAHPMETGFRTGPDGALVPRDIIHRFLCTWNGQEIFSADLFPAISANPYLAFTALATQSGTITFRWIDDEGGAQVHSVEITVA